MRTAKEVCNGIFECLSGSCRCSKHLSEEDIVLKALTAFRNEALDEAAKVADARCQCPHHISIAFEIRALKK